MKNSANITALLEQSELKKTPFRRELLRVLKEAKTPLAAAQIFNVLIKNKKLKANRFDRATLFRNLKILVKKNILSTTEFGTGAAYYCLNSGHPHHHHVFCVKCETVMPLEICAIGPMIDQARRLGFKILNHRLELLGICPECSP